MTLLSRWLSSEVFVRELLTLVFLFEPDDVLGLLVVVIVGWI